MASFTSFTIIFICEWLVLFGVLLVGSSSAESPVNGKSSLIIITVRLPAGAESGKEDEYLCTSTSLRNITEDAGYIQGFDYNFNQKEVHHFLLYGCYAMTDYFQTTDHWPCNSPRKGVVCEGRKQIPLGISSGLNEMDDVILNRTKTARFPQNVGFGIGPKFGINFLLLEMHFVGRANGAVDRGQGRNDSYGVQVHVSRNKPKYYGGMLTMAAVGFHIPPRREKLSVNVNCQPKISQKITPYAYWVHTHELGKVVSGYKVNRKSGTFTEIARWTHRWPQPVILASEGSDDIKLEIQPGDFLAARCTYSSTNVKSPVQWGNRRKEDEMCNLFIFYFTLSSQPDDLSLSCVNELSRKVTELIPRNSDVLPVIMPEVKSHRSIVAEKIRPHASISHSPICHLYARFHIPDCPYTL